MQYNYIRRGQGPVLVLQHGFLSGSDYWAGQIDYFSSRFDVIATTLPGFGDHADQPALDRIEDYAAYLQGLLDHAGVERCHLLGHSMGGMIAQQAALDFPDRIDHLVLFGTGPNGVMPGRFETLEQSMQRVQNEGAEKTIACNVATWFVREEDDPHYPDSLALALKASMPAILGGYRAMGAWKSEHRLTEISLPTLVIWGDCDRAYKRPQVDLLLNGIDGAKLSLVKGSSHNSHLEQPAFFNSSVDQFLP